MPNRNQIDEFLLDKDHRAASEITQRLEPKVMRITGFDRVSQVKYQFHTDIKLTPIDRW